MPMPMPARKFVFLKADQPNIPQATPPQNPKNHERQQQPDSRKKRLLLAIRRDLNAASAQTRDTSADSATLVEKLETVRTAPHSNNLNSMNSAALQLSQSVAHIERFIVDQMPQGSSGDGLLAAWNNVVANSIGAAPLMRHARPRVIEQLRCKAETAQTSSGSRLTVFCADCSDAEQSRINRIEDLLTHSGSRAYVQLPTPRSKAASPRAQFIQPKMQHASKYHCPPRASIPVVVTSSGDAAGGGRDTHRDKLESASSNALFERLIQVAMTELSF